MFLFFFFFAPQLFIFLQTYLILLSSFIMVAIGIDRYFCICHPFLRVVTVPRAKVILVILTVVSIAICTVPCIFYSVYQMESYNQTIIIYNSTLPQVHDDHAALGADSNPSNLTSWVASLSDVVLPSNAPFSYGASPRASYASGAGVQATTASSPALYTNGLFLEPDQDFLNSIVGEDAQTVSPPHSPSSLLQAAALTTAAGAGNFLNSTNMSPFSEFNTSSSENASYTIVRAMTRETYTGYCYQSYAILPYKYMTYYQKFHASIFLFEFIILALLYILIYRSILVRRAWKAKRRRMSGYASTVNGRAEETQLTHINAHVNAAGADGAAGVNGGGDAQPNAETGLLNQKTKDPSAGRVSAAMRDRAFYANIRTAAMLFVVTVAFVVSFLPSWFMGLKFFKFNMIVFYMFYINNVINPFIYAFMNKAFRDDLVQLLKGCLRH